MNKRAILSWILYDFANSTYSSVIAAVVFPVFFVKHIAPSTEIGDLWWGRALSLSMALVAVSSPFMGALADLSGRRKRFLILYTLICVGAIWMLGPSQQYGMYMVVLTFVVANFAMEGATVFYNAFLPLLVPRQYYGRLSGWGFGVGYIGSFLSLLIALFLAEKALYTMLWTVTGGVFLLFSLPAFFFLPADSRTLPLRETLYRGAKAGIRMLQIAIRRGNIRAFLLSYFFYKDGINTVIAFSSIFAAVTLGFKQGELVLLYLLIQIMAFIGAFTMAAPTDRWGAKKVVMLSLLVWCLLSVLTYFTNKTFYWFIASAGGFVLGSTQAASRALYSSFIPSDKEAEYFGLYNLVGKTSSIIGPLIFGWLSHATSEQRLAVLSVAGLFIAGILLLLPVKEGCTA